MTLSFTRREDKVRRTDFKQLNKGLMSVDTAMKETNKR